MGQNRKGTDMTATGWIAVGLIGIAALPAVTRAESAATLLEQGIQKEETAGDLDAAMRIYEKIVKDARADLKYVAEAYYRLGVCNLKRKQHRKAIDILEELIRTFPEQKDLVAKSRRCLAAARGRMTGPELAAVVKEAVMVISTCAESDPRVPKQLASLEGLDSGATAKELAGFLDAESNTVRRSAVYILWKADLADIAPAIPKLMALCKHKEELTRGMAALALGGRKVGASYQTLTDMALKDEGGFARRCAAYALGLLGRPEAKDVLQKVLEDKDAFVRSNAEAALRMLVGTGQAEGDSPKVIRSSPANFADDVPAAQEKISVTFDRPMMDGCWAWVRRFADKYPETTGKPSYDEARTTCTITAKLEPGKVYWIGINIPPYTTFMSTDRVRARQHVLLFATKSADGKPTPIPDDLLRQAKAIIASAGLPAPTVAATSPKALADDVPASTEAIRVTFDQEMMDGSWSWVQFDKETYPQTAGEPSYDKTLRTCTLPVKLQTGKVYWVQVNSEKHTFFQTAAEKSAAPYVILFATRGPDGKPTPIPAALRRKAEAINIAASRPPSPADKRAAEDLAAEGWRLWGQRKLVEAEAKLAEAVRRDPTNANAWNGLGWAQQNQGKVTSAEHAFGKCLALDPKHAGALNGLGWIAKARGDTDAAVGFWRQAIEALPSATAALNGLATTCMELGRFDEAIRYYEAWLKVEPDNAEAKAALAKARKAKAEAKP